MKFLYDFNFNDSSESTTKEFFKKFLEERNQWSHEDKDASYSARLTMFFGDRDDTLLGFDEWENANEYADSAIYSIHLTHYFDEDINKTKFRFELLEDECENDFPVVEEDIEFGLGLNEEITESMLDEVYRAYSCVKKHLVECAEEYMNSNMSKN